MAEHGIVLDLKAGVGDGNPALTIRQGERDSEVIRAAIMDDGAPADLSGLAAVFNCITPGGNVVSDDACTVEGNVVTYVVSEHVAATSGLIRLAYFDLVSEDAYRDSTEGMLITVSPSNSSCVPQDYYSTLAQLTSQYYAAINGAKEQTANHALLFGEAERGRAESHAAEEARHEAWLQEAQADLDAWFSLTRSKVDAWYEEEDGKLDSVLKLVRENVKATADNSAKVSALWGAVFAQVTGNPFTASLESLDGFTVRSGVWDGDAGRLVC